MNESPQSVAMRAAVRSYQLAASLSDDAGILWRAGRVSTAAGLAVASLEADSKGSSFVAEVTQIGRQPSRNDHRQRIGQALSSLRLLYGNGLQDIAGDIDMGSLDVDRVWDIRQRAFYVDRDGDIVRGPDEIDSDVAASVLALATNVVATRGPLLQLDFALLAEFFVDYGAAYRRWVEPVDPAQGTLEWATATTQFFVELGDKWDFEYIPPYGVTTLQRR